MEFPVPQHILPRDSTNPRLQRPVFLSKSGPLAAKMRPVFFAGPGIGLVAAFGVVWLASAALAQQSSQGPMGEPSSDILGELDRTLEPPPALVAGATPSPTPPAPAPAPLETIDLQAIFVGAAGGDTDALPVDAATLIAWALENNPDIKIQRLQSELGETDVRRALGFFDPKFQFSTQYTQSDTPQNAEQFIATGGETTRSQLALLDQLIILQQDLDVLLAQIQGTQPTGTQSDVNVPEFRDPRIFSSNEFLMLWGLTGRTPLGTQYSLGLNQLRERNDLNNQIPPSLFYPETTTTAAFSLSQPLLKNFGPAANMASVRISRLQRRIGWFEWKQQLILSLSEVLNRYFDLVFAAQNLAVRLDAVHASRLLETQNIRRVEQGKMRPSDVWEAQTALSNNVDVALRAINAYVEAQNSLKLLVFSEKAVLAGPPARLVPQAGLEVPPVVVDRPKFLAEALAKRPERQMIQAKAQQEGIRVRFARNQAWPEVNLQASYGLTGLEEGYGSSFANAFGGQGTQWTVGVTVSIPLGNIEGRATLDAAKYRERQVLLALEKTGVEISIALDSALSLLETSRQQMIAARDTSTAARNTAEIEQKLLEEGKSTTFEVVRLQNNAADARSRELAAIATHRKHIVRLAVARGALLEELGIDLEKEAWRDVRRTPPRARDLDRFLENNP
jgi:outer membrane protein